MEEEGKWGVCSCQAFTATGPGVGASWVPALPNGQFSQASWAYFIRGEFGAGSEVLRKYRVGKNAPGQS